MKPIAWMLLLLPIVGAVCADTQFGLSSRLIAYVGKQYGENAKLRVLDWQRLIATGKGVPIQEKLKLANDFFNRVEFVSDLRHWGKADYWATPVEMLATNGGDCEDFAIGKYFTLLALGFPMDRLRINYVMATTQDPANQAHMVLTYYPTPSSIPFVLDNLIPEIKLASARPDLIPVYSFNGAGLWLAKERGAGRATGSSSKISLWAEMNARMGKELR